MNISHLKNKGMQAIHQSDDVREAPKTIIVLGVARSGTSMVASVLESMGVHMGDNKDEAVLEDRDIAEALENDKMKDFMNIVAQRNQDFPKVWGWKRPSAYTYAKKFLPYVRNPHFIVIFRDPLAISLRNEIAVGTDLLNNMQHSVKQLQKLIEFVQKNEYPMLLVSYEKAMLKKKGFVKEMANFCGLKLNKEQLLQTVEAIVSDKPEYLMKARKEPVNGAVDPIENGVLRGWAYSKLYKEKVTLDIAINGTKVAQIEANEPREDLQKLGYGNSAFTLNIASFLKAGNNKIVVRDSQSREHLKNSPIFFEWN